MVITIRCNMFFSKKKDDDSKWGVWNCDNTTYNTEWNIKDVDCETANEKYDDKVDKDYEYPTFCADNGYS